MYRIHPFSNPCQPHTISIEDLTPALFAKFRGRKPLLVRNFTSSQDLHKWSPHLGAELCDALAAGGTVEAMQAHDNVNFVDSPRFVEYVQMQPAEMIDQVRQSTSAMHAQRRYCRLAVPHALLQTLHLEDRIERRLLSRGEKLNPKLVKVWLSSPGCTTPLHYDRCHGIIVQIVGNKYFLQFNAQDGSHLYPSKSHTESHLSRVQNVASLYGIDAVTGSAHDCFDEFVDSKARHGGAEELQAARSETLEKFPRLKEVDTPFGTLLGPGDALYTPPGWYHEVLSISGSVSVTVPWDMTKEELRSERLPYYMMV